MGPANKNWQSCLEKMYTGIPVWIKGPVQKLVILRGIFPALPKMGKGEAAHPMSEKLSDEKGRVVKWFII